MRGPKPNRRQFGEKAKLKHPKETLGKLLSTLFKGKIHILIIVFICIVLSALSSTYLAIMLKSLIDDYITPMIGQKNPDFQPLIRYMGVWTIVMAAGIASMYLMSRLMAVLGQEYMHEIRVKVFKKLESLPLSFFDTHPHGQVMSIVTNDTDTMNQMISQSLVGFISSVFTIIFVFIAMLLNNLLLTLVVVFSLGFVFITMKVIGSKSGSNFVLQQAAVSKVNSHIEEMISGVKVIKVFNHEKHAKEDFDKINDELFLSMSKANSYANMMIPVINNLGNLQYVLLVLFGSLLALSNNFVYTIGSLAAFLQLSRSFSNPIGQISHQMNFVLIALAGAERIFEFLEEKEEIDDGYVMLVNARKEKGQLVECKEKTNLWAWKHTHHDGSVTYVEVKGDIRFENVSFSYVPDKLVLKDISLYAKPGQMIAFVGSTGAGKTTITNLLNRFYEIQSGKIRFDGINIGKIKKSDLRRALGIILQDTHLFTGTIMENLRFGNIDASDDEVIEAAKLSGAHDFIMMMKEGYSTLIKNDGEGLSGGQRQLLAIARAAVANPPVLIMDEATSSVDTNTEEIVQKGIQRLMEGRTVLVIAHRLSTVKNADAIMVLENGSIIERGSHDALIDQKGTYYKLYTGAFELS